jgi:hypothetical protein
MLAQATEGLGLLLDVGRARTRRSDFQVTLSGADGVLYLASPYHDAGEPVMPLNDILACGCQPASTRRSFSSLH